MRKSIKTHLFKNENHLLKEENESKQKHKLYGRTLDTIYGFERTDFELFILPNEVLELDLYMDKPLSEIERYILSYRMNKRYGKFFDYIRIYQYPSDPNVDPKVWKNKRDEQQSGSLRDGIEGKLLRKIGLIANFKVDKNVLEAEETEEELLSEDNETEVKDETEEEKINRLVKEVAQKQNFDSEFEVSYNITDKNGLIILVESSDERIGEFIKRDHATKRKIREVMGVNKVMVSGVK